MNKISDKSLEDKIVKAYRGLWKLLNKRINDNMINTFEIKEFKSLEDAFKNFQELCEEIFKKEKNQYVLSKLNATIFYIKALTGDNIPFENYIINTIGCDVVKCEQEKIDDLKVEIEKSLKKINIKFTREEINEKFFTTNYSQEEIEYDDKIQYTMALLINDNGYSLKINPSNLNNNKNKASIKYAIMHELCGHAMQLESWKTEIKKGNITEICGCQEDYGPEIFCLEGIGESIAYYIFEDYIDEEMHIYLKLDRLEHLVQNNAYIINETEGLEKAKEYYLDNYILAEDEKIKTRLLNQKQDAFYRANYFVYSPALEYFLELSEKLNSENKQKLFRQLYREPMTFNQIKDYIDKLVYGNRRKDISL